MTGFLVMVVEPKPYHTNHHLFPVDIQTPLPSPPSFWIDRLFHLHLLPSGLIDSFSTTSGVTICNFPTLTFRLWPCHQLNHFQISIGNHPLQCICKCPASPLQQLVHFSILNSRGIAILVGSFCWGLFGVTAEGVFRDFSSGGGLLCCGGISTGCKLKKRRLTVFTPSASFLHSFCSCDVQVV